MTYEARPSGRGENVNPAVLSSWGWDEHSEKQYAEICLPADLPGRLIRTDLKAGLVALATGEAHLPVQHSLLAAEPPVTGDWVVVRGGEIAAVLPRRSCLVRTTGDREQRQQAMAANIDRVLVAEPLGERFRARRLERLLVVAWQSGALPMVVLTKADCCDDLEGALRAAAEVAPGVSVHAVCPPEGRGTDELLAELEPMTTAVVIGRSGAGKSTLANALSDGLAELETAAVRHDGKGRHTTVTRELIKLANGALLIDTPGVRSIGLGPGGEGIGEAFGDVETAACDCRFGDCRHESEPGCAVIEAIEAGELEADRLASYRRLLREQEHLAAREDPRLRAERAARWRAIHREARRRPRR